MATLSINMRGDIYSSAYPPFLEWGGDILSIVLLTVFGLVVCVSHSYAIDMPSAEFEIVDRGGDCTVCSSDSLAIDQDFGYRNDVSARFGVDTDAYQIFLRCSSEQNESRAKSAIERLEKLLVNHPARKPWTVDVKYRIGVLYRILNRLHDAERMFRGILLDVPKHPMVADATVELGQVYFLMGRKAQERMFVNSDRSTQLLHKAISQFSEYLKLFPSAPQASRAQYMIGSVNLFLGNTDEAARNYALTAEKYSGAYKCKAIYKLAELHSDMGRREAVGGYERLIKECPDHPLSKDARTQLRVAELLETPASKLNATEWVGNAPKDLADLRGKVVLALFWRTWCPTCRDEVPHINELYDRYAGKNFELISITKNDRGQTTESLKKFMADHTIKYPAGVDGNGEISGAYRISTIPAAVLIDKSGKIRWHSQPSSLRPAIIDGLLIE